MAQYLISEFSLFRPALTPIFISATQLFRDAEAICSFNTVLAGAAQFLNILSELISATDSLEENIIRGGDLSRVQELLSEVCLNVLITSIFFLGNH